MLRNVRDDSMRGLGSEHLLRVHDSHFQLGCCSPTRAFLILCFALPLLEYSILIIASMLSFQKHAFYCGNVMQRAGPSLVALHRVASGMNNGCRQLAVSQCCNLQTIFISHVQLSRQLPIIVIHPPHHHQTLVTQICAPTSQHLEDGTKHKEERSEDKVLKIIYFSGGSSSSPPS